MSERPAPLWLLVECLKFGIHYGTHIHNLPNWWAIRRAEDWRPASSLACKLRSKKENNWLNTHVGRSCQWLLGVDGLLSRHGSLRGCPLPDRCCLSPPTIKRWPSFRNCLEIGFFYTDYFGKLTMTGVSSLTRVLPLTGVLDS